MRKVAEVAAAVCMVGPRVLITRRAEGAHMGGLWEFPGGKRERGETLEACLVREIREELDCAVTIGPVVATTVHEDDHHHITLTFFECTLPVGPGPGALFQYRWARVATLRARSFPPADRPVLALLRARARDAACARTPRRDLGRKRPDVTLKRGAPQAKGSRGGAAVGGVGSGDR